MNTFRLQLRFLVPLLLTLGVAAYLALPLVDRLTLRWFSRDLVTRGELLTNALSDSISDAVAEPWLIRKLQCISETSAPPTRRPRQPAWSISFHALCPGGFLKVEPPVRSLIG